ncbi:lipopolysaccharide kinase InaA family protein [Ectobacillus ponti]|uniref:Protein kinase domain-containing protein n=1 Tax=Ectobacillus ponti TaxID=2961894 RepID=A0AA41XD14_9BACI|nr:lipopolysaccharide kinase InaA family protein [Ectobacillus ponti]MCP8970628.1 hypothetical protein [Ectobacillus ponti]
MKTTFSIEANGQELLLVDHYFFYDLLNPAYTEAQRKQVMRAIKDFVPQHIADARKVNSQYRLFIGKYAINTLKLTPDDSLKRIVNAYLDYFMDYVETASFFDEGRDPEPDDIVKHELEFYRNLLKSANENQRAVLLTSEQNAAQWADRLIDIGLAKVISFSPEHGFVEYKKVEPKEGDVVYCDGVALTLQQRIGDGGEADVFELVPGKLAKVYKTGNKQGTPLPNCFKFQEEMRQRNERLSVLLHDPGYQLNDRYIILPQHKLTDQHGNLVGIVMEKAEGIVLSDIITKNQYPFESFKRSDLLTIAKKIIIKFKKLHTHGIIMGDINLKNILVDAKSPDNIKIYIIDLDSCQIEGFPSTFEQPEFTDPVWLEQREKHGFVPRTIENEYFTLMLLLFMILFKNAHPYTHPTGQSLEDSTRKRLYPYKIKEKDIEFIQREFGVQVAVDRNRNEKKAPSLSNYTHSHLPRYIKCLFYVTFAKQGHDFRPSTTHMMKAIEHYLSYLEKNPESDKIIYDNFAIAKEERVHFKCSCKSCQKPYYYHYGKVLTHFQTSDPYLYCNECISLYDTHVKKMLTDESLPEKERLAMKAEWESTLNKQNVEALLRAFFSSSPKHQEAKAKFDAMAAARGGGPSQPPKPQPQPQPRPQRAQQPQQQGGFISQLLKKVLGN